MDFSNMTDEEFADYTEVLFKEHLNDSNDDFTVLLLQCLDEAYNSKERLSAYYTRKRSKEVIDKTASLDPLVMERLFKEMGLLWVEKVDGENVVKGSTISRVEAMVAVKG